MAEEMHWYDSSTWKKALEMWVYDSGQWKEALQVYIYDFVNSSWRLCHVSPNACYSFQGEYVSSVLDCSVSLPTTFHSNFPDPQNNWSTSNVYIFDSTGCGTGIGAAFVQLDIGNSVLYNFETNSSSKIIDALPVNC